LGVLKSFGGKRHISAQNLRRVEDFNEVHYHLLEALYISLTLRNPNKVSDEPVRLDPQPITLRPFVCFVVRLWEAPHPPLLFEPGTPTLTTYPEVPTHRMIMTTDGPTNPASTEPS
jgi:hypothetical protein